MFIEQAYRGVNSLWRTLLVILLGGGVLIIGALIYIFEQPTVNRITPEYVNQISKNFTLFANLSTFAFLLMFLLLLIKLINKQDIVSLTTSRLKIDFSRVSFSFLTIVVLQLLIFFISYQIDNSEYIWNFMPERFFVLVVISLLLLPFQIGYEEYFFRSYLMQRIGIAVKNRWFPLISTSVLFGILHAANPEVAEFGYSMMIFYIGTGLLLGIITLMDDGMELALGYHLGNNLIACLIVSSDFAALQTDALYRFTGNLNKQEFITEMVTSILIVYPIILFIFAKKYHWNNWIEKLTGRVKTKQEVNF